MANPWELPADIDELIRRHGGAVHTATARRAGISRKRLQRLADDGRLTRLATGIYAPTTEIADLDPWAIFGPASPRMGAPFSGG